MKLFSRRSPEDEFWDWFKLNQSQIAAIAHGTEPIISELKGRLEKVQAGLTWERGQLEDGTYDFVISANGNRDIAPAVRRLAAMAPQLPGWQVTAFRPVREPKYLTWEGVSIDPQEVYVGLLQSPVAGPFNIAMHLPGLTDSNLRAFQQLAFLLLDGFLGEEDVIYSIGEVRFLPTAEDRSPHCVSLSELRAGLGLQDEATSQ